MGQPLVIPSPSMVPTGFSTVELLLHTNASSLMTVPLILEEICLLPDDKGIAAMLPLQYVAFGGGPLKPSIGEKLVAAGVRLLKVYGLTELGPIGTIFNPTADYDWNYFRLRQDMDLELRLIPGSVNEVQQYQLIAHPPGWPVPFEVQDRLVSNPENPLHEFNPVGRTDNLINLVTGEKVLPAILEAKLCESIQVKAAIAFGDGQFELGVIVEPALPLAPKEHGRFKSLIWPIILEAGSQMDNHAKISSKEAIIIVPAGMEIPRSDKGTVRRKDTLQLFEAEIASVYTVLDSSYSGNLLPRLDMNRLEQGIKDLIEKHLDCNWSENGLKYSDDLFELGMDSLQAVRLRRLLLSSLPESDNSCLPVKAPPRDFVYQHPSIASMANYLRKRDETGDLSTRGQDMIEEYVKRYSTGIPGPISDPERFGSKETVVLLTGSTGSLGTYLLAHLSSLTSVAQVICLNRVHPEDMRVQQERAAAAKGAHISEQAWSKIKIIQARSAAPFLGIEKMEYENLQKKITHILHNAWPMDFKRTLPSFESHFQTLKNLINLARDAHEIRPDIQPRLLFISSISVVGQYGRIHCAPAIPEIPMMDSRCANPFGYGQAKLVCEKIIENAANAHCDQIEAGYVRLGQISGSTTTGFWNSDEHFPSLLKSSQHIGRLPRIEGTLSWLPVDRAAESLSELLLSRVKRSGTLIYHLENPIRQSAQGTLAVIASKLGIDGNQFLAMDEWVRQVCEADDESERDSTGVTTRSGAEGDPNPGKRLAQFFSEDFRRMSGGDVVMDTRQARNISGTLARSDVVNEDLIAAYIDHWCKIGFIRQKSQNIDVARS
jgi:thioester reductase-like protein